jgi:hypothetical protein
MQTLWSLDRAYVYSGCLAVSSLSWLISSRYSSYCVFLPASPLVRRQLL